MIGLGGLLVSAASRVGAAGGPVQAEAQGYAGTSVGEWTCGPSARATYGGIGGHARVYVEDQPAKRPPEDEPNAGLKPDPEPGAPADQPSAQREDDGAPDLEPRGFSIGGGAGAEYRGFKRTECNGDCSVGNTVPPNRVLAAGRGNVGWDWDYFGLRLGALGSQRWADNSDTSPRSFVVPDIDLRFGRRAGVHGGLGFGAYDVSTIFRPGAYLSLGYASGPWVGELHGGFNLVFDGQVGGRADLAVRCGISRIVAPGFGFAVSSAQQISPEGRVFIVFTP